MSEEFDVATELWRFSGYLTTLKNPIVLSEKHDSAPMADITAEFIKLRGIDDSHLTTKEPTR